MTRLRSAFAFFLVLITLGAAAGCRAGRETPPPPSPNVVLITIDTLRADRLRRGLTPTIDALADAGVRFDNARSAVPLTLPSHVTIMTGLLPTAHGVRDNGAVFTPQSTAPTLARRFHDAGLRTAAFVGAYVLDRRFGLADGFDVYDDRIRRKPDEGLNLEAERRGSEVADAAIGWVNQQSSRFFLWVHLYDPHAPYEPPAEFLSKAGGNAYDGEVAYADAQVARIVDALRTRGVLENSVIAVAGDHGEGLGEHGEHTHGMLAYDSTLRVPLVIASGGRVKAEATADSVRLKPDATSDGVRLKPDTTSDGVRLKPDTTSDGVRLKPDTTLGARIVTAPVSLSDLAPTLLHAAGLPPQGPSPNLLAPQLAERDIYAETQYPRAAGWHPLTVLVGEKWKIIQSSETELYDLSTDPAEKTNVAADHAGVVQGMVSQLAKISANAAPAAATAPSDAAERLRALGYVSGSSARSTVDPKAPNPAKVIAAWGELESALAQVNAGRSREALPALKSLVTRFPDATLFISTYGRALKDDGRSAEAVAVYKQAVTRIRDAGLFHDLAIAARAAGNIAEATKAEQAALALGGKNPEALNGLGLLHAEAGRAREAAAAFEQATSLDPSNASYWTNLGNARRELSDLPQAEAAYRRALDLDPNYSDAANGIGSVLVQSGRPADAVSWFERAIQAEPEFYEAWLNLGIALQESGQREKSAAVYREILAKAPARFSRERSAASELLRQVVR